MPDLSHEPAALRALARLNAGICAAGLAVASALLLTSLVLIGWAVAMRYGLNRPPVWTDDAVSFMLVAIVMCSAAQVLRRGEHIGVDVFTERLGGRAGRLVRAWGALAALAVAVILVVNGWQTAMQSRMFGIVTEGHLELPVWWLMLLMPLGGTLLGLVALEALWRLALGLPAVPRPHGTAHGSVHGLPRDDAA